MDTVSILNWNWYNYGFINIITWCKLHGPIMTMVNIIIVVKTNYIMVVSYDYVMGVRAIYY